jgi:hypothetical protein
MTVAAGKDIRFDVDYEYRRLPDGPSGVISELPLDLLLHQTDHGPQLLYGDEFGADPLAQFEISDDIQVTNGPGAWNYDAAGEQVVQTASIRGGNNNGNSPNKLGTRLVLQPSVIARQASNWVLHAEIGADQGTIGLVFNYVDSDNYHFFLMNRPGPYRFLAKREGGVFSFLDVGGRDNSTGYDAGDYSVRIVQQHGEFQLAIDNTPLLSGRDNTTPPDGRVGFFCRNCSTARFRSLRWVGL